LELGYFVTPFRTAQELGFPLDGRPSIGLEIVQFVWFEAT